MILTGINGATLTGLIPFVVMGNALTKAETTDGKPLRMETVTADEKAADIRRRSNVSVHVEAIELDENSECGFSGTDRQ